MWENTEAWRQALLLAFFFSLPNLDINIVWVTPFLLELHAASRSDLHRLFELGGVPDAHAHRFRDTFSVEL